MIHSYTLHGKGVIHMTIRSIIKFLNLPLFILMLCSLACAPLVKTDMDTYLQNTDDYEGKRVMFAAKLEDLLQRYERYRGKKVEVTAPVLSYRPRNFWTWNFILGENGNELRAYETEYRIHPDRFAAYLVKFAMREGGEVTIQGRVENSGIELDQIIYKDISINTNYEIHRNHFFGYYY